MQNYTFIGERRKDKLFFWAPTKELVEVLVREGWRADKGSFRLRNLDGSLLTASSELNCVSADFGHYSMLAEIQPEFWIYRTRLGYANEYTASSNIVYKISKAYEEKKRIERSERRKKNDTAR